MRQRIANVGVTPRNSTIGRRAGSQRLTRARGAGRGIVSLEPMEQRRLLSADVLTYSAEAYPFENINLVPPPAGVTAPVFTLGTLSNSDDRFETVNLNGNTFTFYGEQYSSLNVGTNGIITFGARPTTSYGNNDNLTVTVSEATIAPLWDDWATWHNADDQVLGKFEANRLIIEWNDIQNVSGSRAVTFQAILELNTGARSGQIIFNYVDLDTGDNYRNGGDATVGIKNVGTSNPQRLLVSQNGTGPLASSVIKGSAIRISTNHAPVLDALPTFVNEGKGVTLTATATDPDGDLLTYAWDTDGDGTYETPGQSLLLGDLDDPVAKTVRVMVSDGRGKSATASAVVTVNNVAPTAAADEAGGLEDTVLRGNALTNDIDPADPLTVELSAGPRHGDVVLLPNGHFTYTPRADFFGTDAFTYTVNDGDGGTATATVTLNVAGVNDAPVAVADAYTTDEDAALVVTLPGVLGNDSDVDGDALTALVKAAPAHGVLALAPDGSFTYTPHANYNGPDSFTYEVNDGAGGTSTATVSLKVNAVNDPPVAGDDAVTTDEDWAVSGNVLGNDSDIDAPAASGGGVAAEVGPTAEPESPADPLVSPELDPVMEEWVRADGDEIATMPPEDLTVSAVDVSAADTGAAGAPALTAVLVSRPLHGTVTLSPDGSFTYVPEGNFFGTDSFTYQAVDAAGAKSAPATVTITVNPVNDVPTALGRAYVMTEDTPLVVTTGGLLGTDADGDTLTLKLTGPERGVLTLNADGTFEYVPPSNFAGEMTFTYTVSDGIATSESATVTLIVNEVNDAPVAVNDRGSTTDLEPTTGNVLVNDSDVDDTNLTAALVPGQSLLGTLVFNPDGTFSYTPVPGFSGTETFSYVVADGRGGSAVGTVDIHVTAEEEPEGTIQLVEDPTLPGKTMLVVNGTDASETLAVVHHWNGVQVYFGFESRGVYQPTGRIVIRGNGGNDMLIVGPAVHQPAWIYGDEGNDVLKLGHGGGVAFGGAGNDVVSGGNGRDLIVGGEGADALFGMGGDDVLVAGHTTYDNRSASADHEAAWSHLHAEWTSARSFEQRVASLRGGGGGLNGSYFLNDGTVGDDAGTGSADILTGSGGNDWFVYKFGEDRVTSLSSTEAPYDLGIA